MRRDRFFVVSYLRDGTPLYRSHDLVSRILAYRWPILPATPPSHANTPPNRSLFYRISLFHDIYPLYRRISHVPPLVSPLSRLSLSVDACSPITAPLLRGGRVLPPSFLLTKFGTAKGVTNDEYSDEYIGIDKSDRSYLLITTPRLSISVKRIKERRIVSVPRCKSSPLRSTTILVCRILVRIVS